MTETEAAFWRAAEQFGVAKDKRDLSGMERELRAMMDRHFQHKQEQKDAAQKVG